VWAHGVARRTTGLRAGAGLIVSVEGSIGAGKSTTAKYLADRLSWGTLQEETTRHPFLADFYTDPTRYAIETELGFVLLHYHQVKVLDLSNNWVADFSPGKDLVFGRMNLQGRELDLFHHVYQALTDTVVKPDLAIFLDLPLAVLQRRIASRGRPYELGITSDYLVELRKHYLSELELLATRVRVLALDGEETRAAVGDKAHEIVSEVLFGQERLL